MTTRTPLHSTKLPLRVWLTGLWVILQSDKGISSVRLAEAIGISQPTAWRHALRLLLAREHQLDSTVEMDEFYIGGSPPKTLIGRASGEDAKASLGPRRHRFLPSCKGRRMPTRARRPATPGQGLSPICPSPRPVGC